MWRRQWQQQHEHEVLIHCWHEVHALHLAVLQRKVHALRLAVLQRKVFRNAYRQIVP
jgi:hypothetical protein